MPNFMQNLGFLKKACCKIFSLNAMKAVTPPKTKIDDLQAEASFAMQHRRYKEAIVHFKNLLKLEHRPDWEQGLAEAYRQRALQIADKGMWQEAIILWDNYTKLEPKSLLSDAYLGWLVHAGQFPKLAKLLAEAGSVTEQGPVGRKLPETLAVLALQNEKLLAAFPQEHPIAKHHSVVKRAIKAYCAGRDEESEEALRQIPSRSPYRNVRTVLKALLLMGSDRSAGLEMLGRVEEGSACRRLAHALQGLARATGPDLVALSELPPKQQALIQKLNGYGKEQLNLLRDAKKIANSSNHRLVFNTVLSNRKILGESNCRRFCLAMLVDFPEGMDSFQKAFGFLSAFERQRIRALHEEAQGQYPQAATHWYKAIEELARMPEPGRDRMDEALILRHIAKLAEHEVPEIAVGALEKSLEVDPGDQMTYVALVGLYERIEEPKEAQEWLERALKRFPKDVELLTLAMHNANRRKAFKKAAGLAKTLLKIDPINSSARQLLIGAHIGHARKQFRAGKFDLAQQELDQARALDTHRRNVSLCIVEGLLALRKKDRQHAAGLLAEAWRLGGGGLSAQFQLNIEVLSLDQPLSAVAGLVPGLDKKYTANRAELSGLVKLIEHYNIGEKRRLPDALKPLSPILTRSLKQPGFTQDDFFNLGQALVSSALFEQLYICGTEALRHFPVMAAAVYFQVYAKCKGMANRMTPADESRLDQAMERAHRDKDIRTSMMIGKFFRELDDPLDFGFDEDLPPGLEDFSPSMAPAMMKRMDELEDMPRAELIAMLAKALPVSLPLKNMSHQELMDIAAVMVMGELGVDLGSLLGGASPFGPAKKLPKSR